MYKINRSTSGVIKYYEYEYHCSPMCDTSLYFKCYPYKIFFVFVDFIPISNENIAAKEEDALNVANYYKAYLKS